MIMDSIGDLLIYLGVVSLVAERITASAKALGDFKNSIANEKLRAMAVHAIAFGTSLAAAVMTPPPEIAILSQLPEYTLYPLIALLASAGSNVWHDALSTLAAFKQKQIATASLTKSDANKS